MKNLFLKTVILFTILITLFSSCNSYYSKAIRDIKKKNVSASTIKNLDKAKLKKSKFFESHYELAKIYRYNPDFQDLEKSKENYQIIYKKSKDINNTNQWDKFTNKSGARKSQILDAISDVDVLIDDVNYMNCVKTNTFVAYQEFMIKYPNSKYIVKVKERVYDSLLFEAIDNNNIEEVKLCLKNGATIDAENINIGNATPLILASAYGHIEIVDYLIKKNAKINFQDNSGGTALMYAGYFGKFKIFQLLLDNGANIDLKNNDGEAVWDLQNENRISPLHYAARDNYLDILRLLIDKGGNPNIQTNDGWTPLMYAGYNGNLEIIQLLLDNNANTDLRDTNNLAFWELSDKDGWTLLHYIAKTAYDRNIYQVDNNEEYNLMLQKRRELLELLLQKGANPNVQTNDGWTPLMFAGVNGNMEVLQILIDYGADIKLKNNENKTICEIRNTDGFTVLHLACYATYFNTCKIVEKLIENGADVNAKISDKDNCFYDKKPLSLLLTNREIGTHVNKLAVLLLNSGADFDDNLCYTCDDEYYNEVSKLLVAKGAEINTKSSYGTYPLLAAVEGQNIEIVKFLLDNGANINIKNDKNETPIMIATEKGEYEIIKLLIEKGAELPTIDWGKISDWEIQKITDSHSRLYFKEGTLNLIFKNGYSYAQNFLINYFPRFPAANGQEIEIYIFSFLVNDEVLPIGVYTPEKDKILIWQTGKIVKCECEKNYLEAFKKCVDLTIDAFNTDK